MLRCEIQDGDTEREYEWKTPSSYNPPKQNEYRIRYIDLYDSGDYRCKGRKKNAQYTSTEWSDVITLTVSDSKSDHISYTLKILIFKYNTFLLAYIYII